MRIVLLDTGRGVGADTIRMWRDNLQLTERDSIALLAWQPPREPLPVTDHYLFGPRLSLRRTEPRRVETLGDLFGGLDLDAESLAAEAAREQAGDDDAAGEPRTPRIISGEPPREDLISRFAGPDSGMLRRALAWRVKRARNALRRLRRSLKSGDGPVGALARRISSVRSGTISTRFAIALIRSQEAAVLFRGADLVFPVDARSQRGAWLLARANPGPDVVVGYPAAVRALARRRAR